MPQDKELMETDEAKELVSFVMGDSIQVPQNLDKMMTNLYQKIQLVCGFTMVKQVKRQMSLAEDLAKMEEELFNIDETTLANMDLDDKLKLYQQASKSFTDMNEFQRRFLAQNKDTLVGERTRQEELASQLMALSPEKLESIMNIIRGEQLIEESESLDSEI